MAAMDAPPAVDPFMPVPSADSISGCHLKKKTNQIQSPLKKKTTKIQFQKQKHSVAFLSHFYAFYAKKKTKKEASTHLPSTLHHPFPLCGALPLFQLLSDPRFCLFFGSKRSFYGNRSILAHQLGF